MADLRKAFTLVEILVVLLVMAILMVIAIPMVIRSKMAANDTYAKKILNTLSSACEWYSSNKGTYPDTETVLLSASPPYLNAGYCGQTTNGYTYTCTMAQSGYTITGTPVNPGASGSTTITVRTGGVVSP